MSKQLIHSSKFLNKKEVKDLARSASLQVLDGIAGYAEMISKIKDMTDDDEVPALVRLQAIKSIVAEYHNLMNFEQKNPTLESNLSDISDEELDHILTEAGLENSDFSTIELLPEKSKLSTI